MKKAKGHVLITPESEANETVLKATHGAPDQPLRIMDLEIPCYVLEDDRRVVVLGGMLKALDIAQGTAGRGAGNRLSKFVRSKGIQPNVPSELVEQINRPIRFRTTRGALAYGYQATILADLCEVVLAARRDGTLHYQQLHIADRCETLMRGFARVGIIALVDEVTGYQVVRDRLDLHKILEAYIAKELLPWTKRFPDEFYEHVFRLHGWQYSPLTIKRPKYVGKITNELVYEQLPPGVLVKLRELNPPDTKGHRRHRHHQLLTQDIGNPHLEKHLAQVIALMKASPNLATFRRLFRRVFPSPESQGEFELAGLDEIDIAEAEKVV